MLLFIFLIFASISNICSQNLPPYPIVAVPSAIRWNSDNHFVVTPTVTNPRLYPLLLEVFLIGKSARTGPKDIDSHSVKLSAPGASYHFKLSTRNVENFEDYKLIVKLDEHEDYTSSILYGLPDLYSAKIETDKGYYKPGEEVSVRILPLTSHGAIYTGELKLSLINDYGFQVMSTNVSALDSFIQKKLKLPEFIKEKKSWKVVVKPYAKTSVMWLSFSKLIKVGHYEMPKIFIATKTESLPNAKHANLTVEARYPHGKRVSGTVIVTCISRKHTVGQGELFNYVIDLCIAKWNYARSCTCAGSISIIN